jgi:hypothetical protein
MDTTMDEVNKILYSSISRLIMAEAQRNPVLSDTGSD